jgi:probable metal-binding protein
MIIDIMSRKISAFSAILKNSVMRPFGAGSRFCTCSADNLTPEGIIDFLQAKGKFVPCADGFQTSSGLMCKHEAG